MYIQHLDIARRGRIVHICQEWEIRGRSLTWFGPSVWVKAGVGTLSELDHDGNPALHPPRPLTARAPLAYCSTVVILGTSLRSLRCDSLQCQKRLGWRSVSICHACCDVCLAGQLALRIHVLSYPRRTRGVDACVGWSIVGIYQFTRIYSCTRRCQH